MFQLNGGAQSRQGNQWPCQSSTFGGSDCAAGLNLENAAATPSFALLSSGPAAAAVFWSTSCRAMCDVRQVAAVCCTTHLYHQTVGACSGITHAPLMQVQRAARTCPTPVTFCCTSDSCCCTFCSTPAATPRAALSVLSSSSSSACRQRKKELADRRHSLLPDLRCRRRVGS